MKMTQNDDLDNKIISAIQKSSEMLMAEKKEKKQKIAIMENGKIKIIDFAKET